MIINSLLDTDLYKFTMMQVVLHHFPTAQVQYRFQCRTPNVDLSPYLDEIRQEVHELCQLKFNEDELAYLAGLRFMKSDFIDFLRLFQLPERCIHIGPGEQGGINIEIEGPWLHTILFEIPVLAIVNEVYFRNTKPHPPLAEGRARLRAKMQLVTEDPSLADFRVAEYGTRRRFSKKWHDEVVATMKDQMGVHFAGTSNVWMAKKHDVLPLGTMAHEYLQACQALGPRVRDLQAFYLDMWAREYRGDLCIALLDVYCIVCFLCGFEMFFCKFFEVVRPELGESFIWGDFLLVQ